MPLLLTILLLLLPGCSGQPPPAPASAPGVPEGWSQQGFLRADEARDFVFPRDHGPHDGYRSEWWYLTGNLEDESGRRFGYQFTLFRIALTPEPTQRRDSAWATSHIWMGHLALTDAAGGAHYRDERFAREALGLAGAVAQPLRVWLEDWRLEQPTPDSPWRLTAASDAFGLELLLRPQRLPLLQGDRGLSQKGREPGNASYYYSITRFASSGRLRLGAQRFTLQGLSWLDREWSTSALDENQVGWDWFSLQLSDGSDLMYYRLRNRDGASSLQSAGTLLRADGSIHRLTPDDVSLTPTRWWQADDGRRYPVAWTLVLTSPSRTLDIEAIVDHQLMDVSVRYWEGAIDVRETGAPAGRGYLEMTGY